MHVATIESNDQRQVWPRQLIPVQLAALGEHRLFWAELCFAAPSDSERGPSDGGHIDVLVDRPEVPQRLDCQPVGDQRRPPRLQVAQFGCASLGQQLAERADRSRLAWLAAAPSEAGALQGHFAEQRAETQHLVVFGAALSTTLRTRCLDR